MVTTSKAALGQHFGDLGGYHRKYVKCSACDREVTDIATQVNRACPTAWSSCDDYYAAMKCGEIRILQ